ncbi:MAG: hypothetical protein P9M13_07445 [Candidatus Ancaeobacter aquaticus]|nr:hypothetical protein [Candidatus Ancaeobacter aquaticus]
MAKAKAVVVKKPVHRGIMETMDAAADAVKDAAKSNRKTVTGVVKATVEGTSKGIYGVFYGTSYGITFVLLSAFNLISDNPAGNGIKDGVVAATVDRGKKSKKSKK